MYTFGASEVEIKSENNQLVIHSTDSIGSAILAYREPLKFQVCNHLLDHPAGCKRLCMLQVSFPDYLQPCLLSQLYAERRAFVVFQPPTNSSVCPGFTMPGSFPGVLFERKE